MSPSSPAILPITNPKTISTGESHSPAAAPDFRPFINHIIETVRSGLSQHRPWSELLSDRSTFSKPESLTDAATRIQKNYSYFHFNYLTVVLAFIGVSIFTNPFSLVILFGLSAAWLFLYLFRPSDMPLVIFDRTFSERETLGLLIVFSIVGIFFTILGFVLISALLGMAIVSAHGAFRTPVDLFLEEHEAAIGRM
ncbi:unnamed protein product [Lactuca saligna]|uniref:PRA1 family protein n=1 Tax=Lactuca saligna TaxID=75948 RepID=A0AA35ZZB4_LACSI|nr:unnamed protein product [Lactuca saligna]